jgi:ketosteroid isomerase-like protein
MKKLIGFFVSVFFLLSCDSDHQASETGSRKPVTATAPAEIKDYEFADNKFKDIGKKGMDALAKGDVDTWLNNYADNASFRWSAGDSLAGKPAIAAYWKKRRTEVIDSLSYSNEVWLPIKVNVPQATTQLPGNYALLWAMVHAKYKTGKSMSQRMHMVFHFDANDKIDRCTQYIDRVPINAAMAK